MAPKSQSESLAEAELDLEIRELQARDEWWGSSASQSNGCCFDATIFQQFFAMGTAQALQQMSAMQRELGNSCETQHQPAPVTLVPVTPVPVTLVHFPEEGDENEKRVVTSDFQCQSVAMKGFCLFLMLLCLQGTQVTAMETSSIHLEKHKEVEADRFARKQWR